MILFFSFSRAIQRTGESDEEEEDYDEDEMEEEEEDNDDEHSSWWSLQSPEVDVSMVSHVHMCNTDTILDSGASHCMFPLNYPNLRKFEQSKSYATMADQSSMEQPSMEPSM